MAITTRQVIHRVGQTCSNAYQLYYAWKHRPPTPAESAQALQQLRVSYDLYQKALSNPTFFNSMYALGQATVALNKARRLDSSVMFDFPHKEGAFPVSQDWLASHYLSVEGDMRKQEGFSTQNRHTEQNSERRKWDREAAKLYRQAVRAYRKALKYNPDAPPLLNGLAGVYAIQGKFFKARSVIKQSLKIDPNNGDTMQAWQSLKPWWYALLMRR